jgi:hypothetical protein
VPNGVWVQVPSLAPKRRSKKDFIFFASSFWVSRPSGAPPDLFNILGGSEFRLRKFCAPLRICAAPAATTQISIGGNLLGANELPRHQSFVLRPKRLYAALAAVCYHRYKLTSSAVMNPACGNSALRSEFDARLRAALLHLRRYSPFNLIFERPWFLWYSQKGIIKASLVKGRWRGEAVTEGFMDYKHNPALTENARAMRKNMTNGMIFCVNTQSDSFVRKS